MKMFLSRSLLCGSILLWGFGGPAVAVAAERITIQPYFEVDSSYTDNLFLSEENAEADIVSVVTAGIAAAAETRTSGFRVDYRLGLSQYRRFSENGGLRHELASDIWWDFSRKDRIEFIGQARVTEDPEEDPFRFAETRADDFAPDLGDVRAETVRRTRNRYLQGDATLRYIRRFGPRDSVTLAYRRDFLRNEDRTIRNREAHSPSMILRFWPVPDRLFVDAAVDYLREDVEDAIGDPGYFEERIRPSVSLTYWILPRQFSLRGGIDYMRGVAWDNALVIEPGERPPDNWYESLVPSIGFSYRWIPRRMEFDGEISRERAVTFGDDGLSDAADDFETWTGRLAVTRFLSRDLEIFGDYTYSRTDFFRDDGGNENYTVQGPSLGFRYRMAEDIPIQLGIGYLLRDQEISGREGAFTLNGSVGQWEFARDATLRFDVSSGYTESNLGAERLGFGFYYDAQLNLGYRFDPYWTADAGAYYRKNRFLDYEDRTDPTGETRDDRILEYRAGLSYRMRTWLFFRLGYAFRDVSATDEVDDYSENRVTFQMGVSPPRPWRIE
jgi:hypothetical protein